MTGRPTESAGETFTDLGDALRAQRIATENHGFVRRLCEYVGATHFEPRSSYLRAVRGSEGPTLFISPGYTIGFVSEDEAVAAAGPDTKPWPSTSRKGLFGVNHPVHGHQSSGGGGPKQRVDVTYAVCQRCFMQLPATGQCDNCD